MAAPSDRPLLDDAYLAAVYRLAHAGRDLSFTFERPAAGPGADPIRLELPQPWTMLTAHNPMSRCLSDEENLERGRALARDLAATGLEHAPSVSSSSDGKWTEPGFAVFGLGRDGALRLGRRYDQRAVIFGAGDEVGLLYPRTERWNVHPVYPVP